MSYSNLISFLGKKRKQNPNIRAPNSKPKNIKAMFAAAAVKSKPKVAEVSLTTEICVC